MDIQRVALCLSYVILYLDICLSQKDCTSVDCPVLQNCIEEVLEVGACCATCVHKGCTCEGYQYYDCVHAGFRKGKVPQGESYFVDFGSTECSCPRGGGRISCHFIPCPDLPSNCIDITQPADGCPQCGRIGCVHGNDKYKAGHSFHVDQCQMCYCPNDGGHLMCSPVSGCDLHGSKKTLLTPPTENNEPLRGVSHLPDNTQTHPREPFSNLPLGDTLPLYKQDPPAFGTNKYDYTLAEPTSSLPLDRDQILKSTASPRTHPEVSFISSTSRGDRRREEPGATQGSPDQERNYKAKARHQLLRKYTEQITVGTRRETITSAGMATTTQSGTMESPTQQEATGKTTRRQDGESERVALNASKDTPALSATADKEGRHGGHHRHRSSDNSSRHVSAHTQGHEEPTEAHREAQRPYPTVQWSPTRRAPVRMREEGDKPRRQAQTLHNYHAQTAEGETDGK